MQALIALHNKRGPIVGCGPHCYDGQTTACGCICRGQNHHRGLQDAAANTLNHWQSWLAPRPDDPPEWSGAVGVLHPDLDLLATRPLLLPLLHQLVRR